MRCTVTLKVIPVITDAHESQRRSYRKYSEVIPHKTLRKTACLKHHRFRGRHWCFSSFNL